MLIMSHNLLQPLLRRLRTLRPSTRRSRRRRSALFALEVLESRQLLSITPVLVADIDGTTVSRTDAPDAPLFGYVNGVTVFVEYQSDGSSKLVSTTLNFGDSQILHEFSQRTNLNGMSFTDLRGTLYFHAVDSLEGDELWKTDGTAAGTLRIWSLGRQPGSHDQGAELSGFDQKRIVKPDSNLLYFNAAGSALAANRRLWQSDGTGPGTIPVESAQDLQIDFSTVTSVGSILTYAADDSGGAGMEPWKTRADGSTVMIADIRPGEQGSSPHGFHNVANNLLFVADDGVHGSELWIDILTTQWMVMDINPGPEGSFPEILASAEEELYFTADDGTSGRELWYYILGPQAFLVSDLNPGPSGSAVTSGAFTSGFGAHTFVFSADNGSTGREAWATVDGETPWLLTDYPGAVGFDPELMTGVGSFVFFSATFPAAGREVWFSNGVSAAGTSVWAYLADGPIGSNPRNIQNVNRELFLVADSELGVSSVYATGGRLSQNRGLNPVARYFDGTQGSAPRDFHELEDGVEFDTNGNGLWRSDGSRAGNGQLHNETDPPTKFVGNVGNGMLVNRNTAGVDQIWFSDGSPDWSLLTSGIALGFQNMGSLGVFLVQTDDDVLTMWTSDGTDLGTQALRTLDSGSLPVSFVASSASDTCSYVLTVSVQGEHRLWKTDGTTIRTVSMSLWDVAPDFSYESGLFVSDETAFFAASQPQTGTELWKSDAIIAGTVLVGDTIPGVVGVAPGQAVSLNGGLVFTGNATEAGGSALWFTDGTASGTTMLTNNLADSLNQEPVDNLLPIGDLVYFTKATDGAGTEFWKTDGTFLGTSLVKDLLPGALSSWPQSLTDIDGQLVLTALDRNGVRQIWISDGTNDGTIPLTSDASGVAVHRETDFSLTDNGILFSGATPETGWELYRIPTSVPEAPAANVISNPGTDVSVAWPDVVNAVHYEVWITSLSNPALAAAQILTTDREWNAPPEFPVGAYRVWVRANSVLQQPSAWSVPLDFVVGDDPVMHAIPPQSLQNMPVFEWTGPANARTHEIWLTNRDAKTRPIYAAGLTATAFAVPDELVPAKYAVWVRSTNTDESLSDWSPLTEFEVLAAPVVLTSGDGVVLDARTTLMWQAVPGATGYDVRIIPVGSSVPSYLAANVPGTTHRLTRGLPSGQFTIYVRALKGSRSFSAWGSGDLLFVRLPPSGLRTTGTVVAGNTSIEWNSVPFATSYTLEIRDTTNGERVLPDQTLTTTSFTPSVPFDAGRYSVRVRSNYATGQSSNWSAVLAFELFRPALSITSSNAATTDATPVITWSSAPAASSYEIYASQSGNSASVYQRAGLIGTSHRIEIPLAAGVNQIWIRGHFADGSRTVWSVALQLVIGPAPVIIGTNIGFSWATVKASTHYELWLNYLGPNEPIRKVVYDPVYVSTSFILPATLPKGTYQLWLRAIRAEAGSLYAGAWGTTGLFEFV